MKNKEASGFLVRLLPLSAPPARRKVATVAQTASRCRVDCAFGRHWRAGMFVESRANGNHHVTNGQNAFPSCSSCSTLVHYSHPATTGVRPSSSTKLCIKQPSTIECLRQATPQHLRTADIRSRTRSTTRSSTRNSNFMKLPHRSHQRRLRHRRHFLGRIARPRHRHRRK